MRTRSRSRPNATCTYVRWPTSTPPFYGGIQYSNFTVGVKQYDCTITDEPVKGPYEKPCKHIWTAFVPSVPEAEELNVPYEWKTNRPFRCSIESQSGHGWTTGLKGPEFSNTSAAVLQGYATEALRQMWPSVNEGLSVINFILELKDLKRMFTLWSKQSSYLKVVNLANASKEAGKTISGLYLNYQFGWKPFIADVMAMMDALTGIEKKIQWLERNSGKVLKRNYRKKLDNALPYTNGGGTVNYGPWINNLVPNTADYVTISTTTARWVYSPKYHATMIYRFKLPDMDPHMRRLMALKDAFGFKLDPSIVWNAIPFSFVVDWFVRVGDFLQSFQPNDLDMQVEVLDFSHSLKYHMITECSARFTKPGWSSTSQRTYTYERSYYERVRTIPSLHAMTVANPGLKQGLLGGALILANNLRGPGSAKVRKPRPSRIVR